MKILNTLFFLFLINVSSYANPSHLMTNNDEYEGKFSGGTFMPCVGGEISVGFTGEGFVCSNLFWPGPPPRNPHILTFKSGSFGGGSGAVKLGFIVSTSSPSEIIGEYGLSDEKNKSDPHEPNCPTFSFGGGEFLYGSFSLLSKRGDRGEKCKDYVGLIGIGVGAGIRFSVVQDTSIGSIEDFIEENSKTLNGEFNQSGFQKLIKRFRK